MHLLIILVYKYFTVFSKGIKTQKSIKSLYSTTEKKLFLANKTLKI